MGMAVRSAAMVVGVIFMAGLATEAEPVKNLCHGALPYQYFAISLNDRCYARVCTP